MSHAVVNYVRIDDAEQAATSTREVVLPRLRGLPGFEHALFVADGGRDAYELRDTTYTSMAQFHSRYWRATGVSVLSENPVKSA